MAHRTQQLKDGGLMRRSFSEQHGELELDALGGLVETSELVAHGARRGAPAKGAADGDVAPDETWRVRAPR